MGVPTHFFFLEGAVLIGPSPNFFWNIGHSPIEAPLWTPSHKIQTNVLPYGQPFQFIYMGVERWANYRGWNPGAIGNILGNNLITQRNLWEPHGNIMGTHWEQGKKQKIPFPHLPSPPKRKKTGLLLSACWTFSLAGWSCLLPFLAWANGIGANGGI